MRTVLLFSAVAILAACADDQHSTAPASSRSASNGRHAAAGNATVSSVGVTPQGKPIGQIGFTQVQSYVSGVWTIGVNESQDAVFFCPDGTVATGGGFILDATTPDHLPFVERSVPFQNGWRVLVRNMAIGSLPASLTILVDCAS
jgi:hypothetical protein